jgi:hypothetical protein
MRIPKALLLAALILASTAALQGCVVVAVAAGVAGVAYVNGDLEATVEASPPKVVEASEAALKGMEIDVTSSEKSGIDGRVVGRSALNKKVEITVKRETDTTSKLSIRIDTFGDESLSRQIYDRIRAELR